MNSTLATWPAAGKLALWCTLLAATATATATAAATTTTTAATPIRLPGCAEMERLAAQVDANERVPINRWVTVSPRSTGMTLVAAVAGPEFAAQYGKPILDWSRDDLQRFAPAVGACMKAASRDKRFDAQKQLVELRRVVQFHLGQPGNAVQRARQTVAEQLPELAALPTGMNKLRLFGLLARLHELDVQQAVAEVRQPIERMRTAGATPARLLAVSLHNLPQAEADAQLARIAATRDALVGEMLETLEQRLGQAPGSVAGLAAVEGVLGDARDGLGEYAAAAQLSALEGAAERARERIWAALEHTIGAVPATAAGSARLMALRSTAAYRALRPDDRERLNGLIDTRQRTVAAAAVEAPIERLATFPATLDGLRQLVAFAAATRRELGGQLTTDARQAFENAYAAEHGERIAAVATEFERAVDAVPETRQGAARIGTLLEEIDAPARSEVYRSALRRAQQIVHAVEAAEQRERCARAMPEVVLDDDDAAQGVLGLGGAVPSLGQLLCDIALAGSRVHGYQGPGFFDDEHQLQITARDGVFRTYTLRAAPIGPDQEALVGVAVADPSGKRSLDLDGWKTTLAGLLPDSEAARTARCERLLNTPEGDLTTSDRMAAVDCVMNSLLGR